ncbi:RHS repeat domain-containing protein [Apibacter adventoris]|nr:RHS repeat-associated core domain-containing protein [Apibacter adventoris]
MQYYYHADHLGSSSYITNLDAQIVQHVEYVPFGEVFIEERNQSWNTPYLFNGKELDEETGLYYYGARYYNPKESVWLSVDPLFEKTMTPYQYTYQNPIKFTDPTGMEPDGWIGQTDENGKRSWTWDSEVNTESQAKAKYGENTDFYEGGDQIFNEWGTNKQFQLYKNGNWGYVSTSSSEATTVGLLAEGSTELLGTGILRALGLISGALLLEGDITKKSPSFQYFYRAMSSAEYASTKGYLVDLKTSGEGPHVRTDISYLLDASFINKLDSKYDYILSYKVNIASATLFETTPFIYTPGTGKGGPVFNAARMAGMPYLKYEKGFSYGFPGAATALFNTSLMEPPKIIYNIKTGK